MTQVFCASEARIKSFLSSIRTGQPIDNGGPWSVLDLFTLAGSVHAAIMSHPPGWVDRADLEALDDEKREAVVATNEQEVIETVRFLAAMATEAMDGRFGVHLNVKDEVKGALALDATGKPLVQIMRK